MIQNTVIVSGYPRTGTSMMMRMLAFGGVQPLANKDHIEKPVNQVGNLKGDYEFRNVLRKLQEGELGPEVTAGKVLKLVAPFIEFLPLDRPLKVIFMLRDMREVIASLLAMKTIWEHTPDEAVADARKYLTDLGVPVLYLDYHEVVKYPKTSSLRIQEFLDLDLDVDRMVTALDPNSRGKKKEGPGELILFQAKPEEVVVPWTEYKAVGGK